MVELNIYIYMHIYIYGAAKRVDTNIYIIYISACMYGAAKPADATKRIRRALSNAAREGIYMFPQCADQSVPDTPRL